MIRKFMLLIACLLTSINVVTAQTSKVTGVVISEEDDLPVVGASVLLVGTSIGTITDANGNFVLSDIPVSAKKIRISFIGMATYEGEIKPNMKVNMKSDSQLVDADVIVGYGTGKKLGSVVGSVSTVSNKALEAKPTMNFADALQGQVAGMQVFTSSGEPTASSSMRVRGYTSLNAGTSPLYILDGAPVSSDVFTSLNPNDIENVTVLKDASSTSIYGARAANGVVYITTKKGKTSEKANITIRGQYGISQLPDFKKDMMNAQEFIQFKLMCDPSLATNPQFMADKARIEKYGLSMDWADYVLRDNTPTYSVDANISGASGSTNYYISAGHFDQEGTSYQSGVTRENFRVNLNTKLNNWLKFGVNSAISYQDYATTLGVRDNNEGAWVNSPLILARTGRPIDFPYEIIENEDGTWSRGEDLLLLPGTGYTNPMKIFQNSSIKNERIMGNLNTFIEITPFKGLTLKGAQAFEGYIYKYRGVNYPWEDNEFNGDVAEQFQRGSNWTFTNTAEYKHTFKGKHFMTLLAGQESIMHNSDGFSASGKGIEDSRLTQLSAVSSATAKVNGARSEYVFNSFFFRGEYNYDEKYYLDASYRRDGSSRFSEDHRWASFYSIGAMYNIKNEAFLNDVEWLNDLRLKISYGTTGNSEIGNYASLGMVAGGGSYNYNNQSGWVIGTVGNSDLTWETLQNFSAGVSTKVFDRLDFRVEYYQKKTVDMLMNVPFSMTTGHSTGMGNVGTLLNTGVDLNMNLEVLNINNLRWNVYANFNYNKTKIQSLFNGLDELAFPQYGLKYQVGHDPNEYFSVLCAGVDPRDGALMYYDLNGNKTKTFTMDNMQFTGKKMFAPCSGGFGTSVSWKGLSAMIDFSWIGERYLINNDRFFTENPTNSNMVNMNKRMLTMWQKPGDITDVPRYGVASENLLRTNYFLENAAFVRLKNVTISYELPKSILKKTKIVEGVRIFTTGRNLLTFTQFSGIDPEIDSNLALGDYPNSRQYTLGLEVKF